MKVFELWDRSGRSLQSQGKPGTGNFMNEEEPSLWFAIYTKVNCEKKVSKSLELKGIVHYCPLTKVEKQWSDRKKISFTPLFPSYVFVKVAGSQLAGLKLIDGVVNFVYWLKKPAVIREEEILTIQKFLSDFPTVRLEKTAISLNDSVKILTGPLMEKEGRVVEIKNKAVKIYLPSLGYNLIAEIQKSNIEILSLTAGKPNVGITR